MTYSSALKYHASKIEHMCEYKLLTLVVDGVSESKETQDRPNDWGSGCILAVEVSSFNSTTGNRGCWTLGQF
jgi:hypothetical protein